MKPQADPITTQVVRYALEQIADEMGYTLVRTARSTVIKEIKDISCAVFDRHGNTVAQAHHAPMLLTGFELGMRALRRRYADHELADGDVIAFNDPYAGGQHVMDLVTFAPVKRHGRLATRLYQRQLLKAGQTFAGPALIEEPTSTTVIPPGWRGRVDGYGSLILERRR